MINTFICKMAEELSVEQRIALFLDQNDITIIPEQRGDHEVLGFVKYTPTGHLDLGERVYDGRTGAPQTLTGEVALKGLQVPGFVKEVSRPISGLMNQTKGHFYETWFGPIHDACKRVEARHPGQ